MMNFTLRSAAVTLALLFPLASAAADDVSNVPKDNNHERLERRSTAYKKALTQGLNEKPVESACYYQPSGCDAAASNRKDSLVGIERPPRAYPQQGYLLGYDGLYHFNSGAMSRR